MLKKIISAWDKVMCKNKSAVLGVVIRYHHKNCVLTVYHLLESWGCGLDSGSPIIPGNSVVGILAYVFFNNDAGIAVSLEEFTPNE
jgi:hypothetical protein